MKSSATRKQQVRGWAGFSNGDMDLKPVVSAAGSVVYGIVYPTRKAARQCYIDVRRVEVREVK